MDDIRASVRLDISDFVKAFKCIKTNKEYGMLVYVSLHMF